MKKMRRLTVLGVVALVLAACGGTDEQTDELPLDAGSGGDQIVAGACLEGEPECDDTFPDSGEPTEPPPPGIQITSVLNTDIDGGFAIQGFYVADESGVRLCEALAESFPPQCGGSSVPFDNSAGADLGVLSVEQGVTWSNQPVVVVGSMVDGVFVSDPI
jgi:hypothetical protein